MNILDLPEYVLEEIFSKLSYDEIAKKRLVCPKINQICRNLLNRGFYKLMKRHANKLRTIKSKLPRRESERRNHPLSKHVDILTCIETRISMLSMTFTKYIETDQCCFIPGKIIDEVDNILRLIDCTKQPLRTHDILQELRDISSMAIEHFDEKIAHSLKKSYLSAKTEIHKTNYLLEQSIPFSSGQSLLFSSRLFSTPNSAQAKPTPHTIFHHNQCQESIKNTKIIELMKTKYKAAMRRLKHLSYMQKKQIKTHSMQVAQLSSQIVELKRRLEESDAKNREQSSSLLKMSPLKHRKTHTKPRTATIILKRRITEPAPSSSSMMSGPGMLIKRFKSSSENEC